MERDHESCPYRAICSGQKRRAQVCVAQNERIETVIYSIGTEFSAPPKESFSDNQKGLWALCVSIFSVSI